MSNAAKTVQAGRDTEQSQAIYFPACRAVEQMQPLNGTTINKSINNLPAE
ncbi:MAG: hypothetical protein Q7T29_07355 [Gallionella sp.]|nr:hypothetical protein [Gallionella sp.]